MVDSAERCQNCGTLLAGKFCHACGQKKIEDKERTIKHFIYQFFGAAFFLENNVFRNLWYLLSKPGFLAAEYLDGRRKRYMTPLSLFLLINLVYFFAVHLSDLNLSLREQMFQPQHKSLATAMVERRLERRETTLDAYASEYDEQSTALSKTLIILHAPVMALLLTLIYLKRRYYFTDHIVFSVYIVAFVMLLSIIANVILKLLVTGRIIEPQVFFPIYGWLFLIAFPAYFAIALKRFYRETWVWTIIKTIPVLAAFVVAHFVYRTLLFLIVFWTT